MCVWRGCRVDLAWRLGEICGTRAEIAHLELKRRLHLELNGVLFVERLQQGDDERKCDAQQAHGISEALGIGVFSTDPYPY